MELYSPERRKSRQKAYQSSAWRKLSKKFRKNNPLCQVCLSRGIYKKSEVADHDDPTWTGNGLLTKKLNALCRPCHLDKTLTEDLPKLKMLKRTEFKFF